jgi:hypothetical protein
VVEMWLGKEENEGVGSSSRAKSWCKHRRDEKRGALGLCLLAGRGKTGGRLWHRKAQDFGQPSKADIESACDRPRKAPKLIHDGPRAKASRRVLVGRKRVLKDEKLCAYGRIR